MVLITSEFVVMSISKIVNETFVAPGVFNAPLPPVKLIWTVHALFVWRLGASINEFSAGDRPPVSVWLLTGACEPEVGSIAQILACCEVTLTVMSFTASPFRSYELTKSPGAHAAVSQSNTSARAGAALKMARKIAAITQKRRGQILIYNFHKLFPGQPPRKFAPNHCVPGYYGTRRGIS